MNVAYIHAAVTISVYNALYTLNFVRSQLLVTRIIY